MIGLINAKYVGTRALVLALTLIGWTGSGSSQMDDNSDWWSQLRGAEQEGCSTPSKAMPSGATWKESYKCVASQKISEKLGTASGLHLGMTAAQVEKILGKPCIESNDSIVYAFDYQYMLPLDERQRRKGKGDFEVDKPFYWFGSMQIKFRGANAYYIAILTGDSQ